jgi:hypothetical protein
MSDDKPASPDKKRLQIQIDEATSLGAYANMTLVNHTETEFILDFVFIPPTDPRAKVRSRIISSPKHAKRFLNALQENVARYESRFGEIPVTTTDPVH